MAGPSATLGPGPPGPGLHRGSGEGHARCHRVKAWVLTSQPQSPTRSSHHTVGTRANSEITVLSLTASPERERTHCVPQHLCPQHGV